MPILHRKTLLVLIVFSLLLLVGCSNNKKKSNVPKKPLRIVSLTYGTDEILVVLVDLNRIIAFSKWADDSGITYITKDEANKVIKRADNNIENIIAMHPDLIISSKVSNVEETNILKEMGYNLCLVDSPKNIEEMRKKILHVAKAVGELEKGEKIVKDMDNRLIFIDEKLKNITEDKEKVVLALSYVGAIGRRGNLLDTMFKRAHLRNAVAEIGVVEGNQRISKEQIIKKNPDVFLLPTWNYSVRENTKKYNESIINDPAYVNITAVKKHQIYSVNDRDRYVASQHVVDAIYNIAKTVYSDKLKKSN